jgi:hypothetical protein
MSTPGQANCPGQELAVRSAAQRQTNQKCGGRPADAKADIVTVAAVAEERPSISDEVLDEFMSVLGEQVSRELAEKILVSCGWNLERALAVILDGQGDQCSVQEAMAEVHVAFQPAERSAIAPTPNRHAQFRSEREQQDAEFQEGLAIDQQREMQRQREEEVEHQQQAEHQLASERAAHAEAERLEALESKRARVEQHPQPAPTEPNCCQLRVCLPSGKRFTRFFRDSDVLSLVYDWVDVSGSEEAFTTIRYVLVEQTPGKSRREFSDRAISLKDAGLPRQTLLFVADCE